MMSGRFIDAMSAAEKLEQIIDVGQSRCRRQVSLHGWSRYHDDNRQRRHQYASACVTLMSGRFIDAMSAAEKLEQIIDADLLSVKSPPMADFFQVR
jgi:hypothetical protein